MNVAIARWLPLLLIPLAGLLPRSSHAEGIPEPSFIFYGTITNMGIRGHPRITGGTLSWTIRPTAGGQPVILTTPLTNLNNQFSYLLKVPCETVVGALTVSSNALRLLPAPISLTYTRSEVTQDNVRASFVLPAQTNFTATSTNRGRIERIDLVINTPCVDNDPAPNGICDDWEIAHFGVTGVDPNADYDGDGMSNYAEYLAGTEPLDEDSFFVITRELHSPQAGMFIEWASGEGAYFTVSRSQNLTTWTNIANSLPAALGTNRTTHIDASATNAPHYFYRVIAQE